jgi:glycosyltransferase involved in cell wall biosynthesis
MTAYNREQYIAQAIESVLASTFEDFELIVVDDVSTDRTVEIAQKYVTDPRVQVHVNEKNLGDYPNRNRAAELARGKYLKYVDADDYLYPHGLEVVIGMMERFPEAALGLASFAQDSRRPFPIQLSPREAYFRHYFEQPTFHRAPLSALIRRDAFNAVGGFTGKRWVGDFELWHILAARYPMLLMPDGIVWYRKHPEQEMQVYRDNPRFHFGYQVVACNQLTKPQCPLAPKEKLLALRRVKRGQARFVMRALIRRQPGLAVEMFRQSGLTVAGLLVAAFTTVPFDLRPYGTD